FVEANRNAIFIAPEAPVAPDEPVRWPRLDALLAAVNRSIPKLLPNGPLIVAGHSGAYRTIVGWLEHPKLQRVILRDGLYGEEDRFAAWVKADGDPPHKFCMTVLTTQKWSSAFLAQFEDAVLLPHIPHWVFTDEQKDARVVSMSSQYGHMEMIREGKV